MRNWIIYKLGGIPREHIVKMYRYRERNRKMFLAAVEQSKEHTKAHHPEYKMSYLDSYALASFAKRFAEIWSKIIAKNFVPKQLLDDSPNAIVINNK